MSRKAEKNTQTFPFSRPTFTFGGLQFWEDVLWQQGWRVQKNLFSGRCRLLDPHNVRRFHGHEKEVRAALTTYVKEWEIPSNPEELLIMMHGLGRSAHMFDRLKKRLEGKGYICAAWTYPSTRRSLDVHVERFEKYLSALADSGVKHVRFVTHSLGSMILRQALSRKRAWRTKMSVDHIVMLAPPFNGARIAERLRHLPLFPTIFGPVLDDLTPESVAKHPPMPADIQWGVIAGGRTGGKQGWNPLLKGDNDGIVTVEEAKPDADVPFAVVKGIHTFLPSQENVFLAIDRFFRRGRFSRRRLTQKEPSFRII